MENFGLGSSAILMVLLTFASVPIWILWNNRFSLSLCKLQMQIRDLQTRFESVERKLCKLERKLSEITAEIETDRHVMSTDPVWPVHSASAVKVLDTKDKQLDGPTETLHALNGIAESERDTPLRGKGSGSSVKKGMQKMKNLIVNTTTVRRPSQISPKTPPPPNPSIGLSSVVNAEKVGAGKQTKRIQQSDGAKAVSEVPLPDLEHSKNLLGLDKVPGLRRCLNILTEGQTFIKYGRRGKPHKTFVFLDLGGLSPSARLFWTSAKANASTEDKNPKDKKNNRFIELKHMINACRGTRGKNFHRKKSQRFLAEQSRKARSVDDGQLKDVAELCLTIVGEKRSLDLQILHDSSIADKWVEALTLVIKNKELVIKSCVRQVSK